MIDKSVDIVYYNDNSNDYCYGKENKKGYNDILYPELKTGVTSVGE